MKKFYFTFGTDEQYPFKGGWVEIHADDIAIAQKVFKAYYPHPDDSEILNCADCYNEKQFESTEMNEFGNFGQKCQAVIGIRKEQTTPNAKAVMLEDTRADVQWLRAALKKQKEKIANLNNQIKERDNEITRLKSKIYDLIYEDEGSLFDDAISL